MSDQYQLFSELVLNDVLAEFLAQAKRAAWSIPDEKFSALDDSDIIELVASEVRINPIVIDESGKIMRTKEIEIDVSKDPTYPTPPWHDGPFMVRGVMILVEIPYTGSKGIFRCRPNTHLSAPPYADVFDKHIRLTISFSHHIGKNQINAKCKNVLDDLRTCVANANNQVSSYNDSWINLVRHEAEVRRSRLSDYDSLAQSLGMQLESNSAGSQTDSVTPERKIDSQGSFNQASDDELFEDILYLIRGQGQTFETTPKSYERHDEEGLRDIILSQLNTVFDGWATGETFRKEGKTDICIRRNDGSAFVGECKIWNGKSSIAPALDQLLGYMTWRDNHATLIIFNKNVKGFSKIVEDIPSALEKYPLAINSPQAESRGEWRILVRGKDDQGHQVVIHVFAFNLYSERS